ncbi:MAG: hypothetical protein R8L53_10335 [Mariprofundales bacterium]
MIRNWKITAIMGSPLCGQLPELDSILAWELSCRLGNKHGKKLTRYTRLSDVDFIYAPIAKIEVKNNYITCCSSPILSATKSEWVEHQSKRFDSYKNSLLIDPKKRKSVALGEGPMKMRYAPLRLRLIEEVSYFVRCERKNVKKLLQSIKALGKGRNYGYGMVSIWEFEEQENDFSIFAPSPEGDVLMRKIPIECVGNSIGYRESFGACDYPYWHPERMRQIAIPC